MKYLIKGLLKSLYLLIRIPFFVVIFIVVMPFDMLYCFGGSPRHLTPYTKSFIPYYCDRIFDLFFN